MRLYPPWLVVEASVEGDLLLKTKSPSDDLGDLVPAGKVFVTLCIPRRRDTAHTRHERVHLDHLFMAVKEVQRKLSRDVRRQRRDLRVYDFLAHGDCTGRR